IHGLERGHELVHANGAVRKLAGTATHFEEVSRGHAVLSTLVDKHHHLRLLEVLSAKPTEQSTAHTVRNGKGPDTSALREGLHRQHLLPIPDGAIHGNDTGQIVPIHCFGYLRQAGGNDCTTVWVDLFADPDGEQS